MVAAQGEDLLSTLFIYTKFQKAADLAQCLQLPVKTDPGLMDSHGVKLTIEPINRNNPLDIWD